MGNVTFTHRDGKLRLYDGSATPYYIELPFMNADFKGPIGRPTGVQTAVLDRGRLTNLTHYIQGPDDPKLAPSVITWSFRQGTFEPNKSKFQEALNSTGSAGVTATTWTVGSNVWTSTKGTTQLLSGGGTPTLFTTPLFLNDPTKKCVTVQVLYIDPTSGNNDTGYEWAEVYFPPDKQNLSETDNDVPISVSGEVYGAISVISQFKSGVAG